MTGPRTPISEDMLQAWVDGEFSTQDSADLLLTLQQDPDLMKRACDTRMLKELVKLAYRDPPSPPTAVSRAVRNGRMWRWAASAVMLLVIGTLAGWNLKPPEVLPSRFALLDPHGLGHRAAAAEDAATRIVFHLTNPDMTVAGELLDEIESMMQAYERSGAALRVEVVAHGDGLALLRERLSRYGDRIEAMAMRYPELTFVACRNTIDRLRVEQGVHVTLLPHATVSESGVDRVVRRQREGWIYIRV